MGKMDRTGWRAWQRRETINKVLEKFKREDGSYLLSHKHIYDVSYSKGKLKVSLIRGPDIIQLETELVPLDEVVVKERSEDG